MGHRILLDGEIDFEGPGAASQPDRTEPLAEATGPGEEVNYSDRCIHGFTVMRFAGTWK